MHACMHSSLWPCLLHSICRWPRTVTMTLWDGTAGQQMHWIMSISSPHQYTPGEHEWRDERIYCIHRWRERAEWGSENMKDTVSPDHSGKAGTGKDLLEEREYLKNKDIEGGRIQSKCLSLLPRLPRRFSLSPSIISALEKMALPSSFLIIPFKW